MTSLKEMELKILHTPSWELEKSPLILKARECQAAISLDTKIVLYKFIWSNICMILKVDNQSFDIVYSCYKRLMFSVINLWSSEYCIIP